MKNKIMMTSASTVALIAGGTQQGLAQEGALPAGYTLNVQGAYGGLNNPYMDKISDPDSDDEEKFGDANSDEGYLASVSLGRQLTLGRDISFGLTLGGNPDNEIEVIEEFGSGFDFSERSNDFNFAALDFEIGHSFSLQAADVRLFYGARALYSNSEQEKLGGTEEEKLGVVERVEEFYTLESTYRGIGPRVGIGFATKPTPIGATGQIGFSGELGAAVLFGEREDTQSYGNRYSSGGYYEESGYSSGSTENKTAASLDAQLGVDYYVSPTSKISVGYQLQQLWNVSITSDEDDIEDWFGSDASASPRLIHGVFVGFTTSF